MDDNARTAPTGHLYESSIVRAGSKRPCPSRYTDQGDDDCDGNRGASETSEYSPSNTTRRLRSPMSRPLSLLARCAINRGNGNPASPLDLSGAQNQVPFGSIGGSTRQSGQHSMNSAQQNTAGNAQTNGLQQDKFPSERLTNPLMNYMACVQPDPILEQGRSHPHAMLDHQYLASMQTRLPSANSSLLRPFGMTPQELLNYAVLVNILQKSLSQGNTAMSNLAFNCSQAMVQSNISTQAEGAAASSSPAERNYPQQKGCNQSHQLGKPNLAHNLFNQADSGNYADFGVSKSRIAGNHPHEQCCRENTLHNRVQSGKNDDATSDAGDAPSLYVAKPDQAYNCTANDKVQAGSSNNASYRVDRMASPHEGSNLQGKDSTGSQHITTPNQAYGNSPSLTGLDPQQHHRNILLAGLKRSHENTFNDGRRRASSVNKMHNDDTNGGINHGIFIDPSNRASIGNFINDASSLPNFILQAQQVIPTRRCVPLCAPDDTERLSTQQCWLRKQIETFPASERDVRARGRNRLLDIGQVGIQCVHCKSLPQEGRGKGSSYFPASIKSIYQSAQNMLTFHFKEDTCPLIPRKSLQQMRNAGETSVIHPRMAPKAGKSRSGGGKAYWEASATSSTGLVDTTVGIRYSNDIHRYRPLESIALASAGGELDQGDVCWSKSSVLARLEDKGKVTDFCFILMSQFEPYCSQVSPADIMEGDEWGSNAENEEALPSIGIVCNFCRGISNDGKQSKGIFLSSKADTMMRNKNLARMYNHLLVCGPDDLKEKLMQAKNIHLPQSDRLLKGWKKQFFENVCSRLHASLAVDVDDGSSYDG